MKRVSFLSLLLLMMSPAVADINQYSLCNNNTLGTYSGTANLRVNWIANTINLDWYNENNLHQQGTCTYGQNIVLPTVPTRPGYNFVGWQLRVQPFDLSTLSEYVNSSANGRLSHSVPTAMWNNGDPACFSGNTQVSCDDPMFAGLDNGKWSVSFDYGTVKGTGLCSSSGGTTGVSGTPDTTSGGTKCWCMATEFASTNSGKYTEVLSPVWVFSSDEGNIDDCAYGCADDCAFRLAGNASFRSALYGINQ